MDEEKKQEEIPPAESWRTPKMLVLLESTTWKGATITYFNVSDSLHRRKTGRATL